MSLTDDLRDALGFALESNRAILDNLENVRSVRLVVKMDRAGDVSEVNCQPEFAQKLPMKMLDMQKK